MQSRVEVGGGQLEVLAPTLVGGVAWRGPYIHLDLNAFLLLPHPLPTPTRIVTPMVCLHAFPWK